MNISILPANHGDSIFITFADHSNRNRNILVDGGPAAAYEFKNSKGKSQAGPLKYLIEDIKARGELIDLLVLTHVDSDHIGGLLRWCEKDRDAHRYIQKVWFNSARLISEHFETVETADRLLRIGPADSDFTSIAEGGAFEDYLTEKNIWDRQVIKAGDQYDLYGATLTILSPDDAGLEALETKWVKEGPYGETSPRGNDYARSIEEHLADDRFVEDDAVHNQSSIAFVLSHNGSSVVFLADAHPLPVVSSLVKLGYSEENKLRANLVKLSHHGSRGNTSVDLLELIDCKRFVVSTNGAIHSLPDKQCLARIIAKFPDAEICFNYPELIERIFTAEDRKSFPGFKASAISGVTLI